MLLTVTQTFAVYWSMKRPRKTVNQAIEKDRQVPPAILPHDNGPQVPGRWENADLHTQEMSPIDIQEAEVININKADAVSGHKPGTGPARVESYGCKRWSIIKYQKPLPKLPHELEGNVVCQELEGDGTSTRTLTQAKSRRHARIFPPLSIIGFTQLDQTRCSRV